MQSKDITYTINGQALQYHVEAEEIKFGKYENIFLSDDNHIQHADWFAEGYKVDQFLDTKDYSCFELYIHDLFIEHLKKITQTDLSNFTLEKYHTYVDDEIHRKFLTSVTAGSKARGGIPLTSLPFSYRKIDERISEICKCNLSSKNLFTQSFWLRIVRPCVEKDNNPPHKDGYLRRNRKMVNLYVGIAGSNEKSSLPFVPYSHLTNEKYIERTYGKALVNGVKFTNPAVTGLYNKSIEMFTPNPKRNEVLVFTPYMIHGGGRNLNSDVTRISLEMRFKKAPLIGKLIGFYK